MIENFYKLFLWLGRILSIINVGFFLYIGIGEGFPNLMALPEYQMYQMLLMLGMVLSSIFLFKWELVFGIVLILFYLTFNYVQYLSTNGLYFWTGYILFLYPVSALFSIAAWFLLKQIKLDENLIKVK